MERAARPGGRPQSPPPPPDEDHLASCPFCPGNEDQTPPEIFRLPPGAARWSVRVVPNKYPALTPDADQRVTHRQDLLCSLPGRGHHEVIIEGPRHRPTAAPREAETLRDVFLAARERGRAFSTDPALRHVALFKNHGPAGGASLAHPHWQLVALPVIPPAVAREFQIAAEYREAHGRAMLEDLVSLELESETRVVEITDEFAVLAAYAPQWTGETWIVPRAPVAGLQHLDDAGLDALAGTLWRTLRRVAGALDEPALNVVVHSAPLGVGAASEAFRWHVRLQPRLGTPAGFELGSGVAVVTLAPEAAAEAFRRQPL